MDTLKLSNSLHILIILSANFILHKFLKIISFALSFTKSCRFTEAKLIINFDLYETNRTYQKDYRYCRFLNK